MSNERMEQWGTYGQQGTSWSGRSRTTITRAARVAISGLALAAFVTFQTAVAAPFALPPGVSGFDGFQFNPPYNTQNPFATDELRKIDSGFTLFTTEKFKGNGRVCSTCHIPAQQFNVTKSSFNQISHTDQANVLGGANLLLENGDIVRKLMLFNINQEFGFNSKGQSSLPEGPFRASMSIGGLGFTTLNNFVCRLGTPTPGGTACTNTGGLPGNANTVDDGTRDIMLGWAGDGGLVAMFPYAGAPVAAQADCKAITDAAAGDPKNLDKALDAFTLAAVKTHFTKSQDRVPGVDFRCPTADELRNMTTFQKWLGRRFELDITKLQNLVPGAEQGRLLFSSRKASCVGCHVNAGATDDQGRVKLFPVPFLKLDGSSDADFNNNQNEPLQIVGGNKSSRNGSIFFELELDALVASAIALPQPPQTGLFSPFNPFDEGDTKLRSAGEPGFNVQSIIEAVRKDQFFHNNAISGSIEDAIAHYFTAKFDSSQGGQAVNVFRRDIANVPITGPVVLAQLGGTDALNKMGLFLRALSSMYAIADCERYVDEILFRFDNGLSIELPASQCDFELNDARKMLKEVRVAPNPYAQFPLALAQVQSALKTVTGPAKRANLNRSDMLGVRSSLQGLRQAIATTPELP